jgi:hypothetical protein
MFNNVNARGRKMGAMKAIIGLSQGKKPSLRNPGAVKPAAKPAPTVGKKPTMKVPAGKLLGR